VILEAWQVNLTPVRGGERRYHDGDVPPDRINMTNQINMCVILVVQQTTRR